MESWRGMKFMSLGSGSSGNCYFLAEGEQAVLIDLGLGSRLFTKICRDYGVPMHFVKGCLLTHDHMDHVVSANYVTRKLHLPLYAQADVYRGIDRNPRLRTPDPTLSRLLTVGEATEIAGLRVTPFNVPHDSTANTGFFIESPETNFCLMTDVGYFTDEMKSYIERAENLVIESNYDDHMLEIGRYHFFLKQRIRGAGGHSSNDETAAVLEKHLRPHCRRVFLCHLSQENNLPEIARTTVQAALLRAGLSPELHVLQRRTPSAMIDL